MPPVKPDWWNAGIQNVGVDDRFCYLRSNRNCDPEEDAKRSFIPESDTMQNKNGVFSQIYTIDRESMVLFVCEKGYRHCR
jgi:hypothetical protein